MKYLKIQKCRNCKENKFNPFFNLGNMELSTYFPDKNDKSRNPIPLNLIYCKKCLLFQLQHNYNLKTLFNDKYGYRSGINQSMKNHFKDILDDISKKILLKDKDVVLDVASNDGTFLGLYKQKNITRIGIDPTINKYKKYYDKKIKTSSNFFNLKTYKKITNKKAKIITSIAVFYDVTNPNMFVKNISKILDSDGLWVLEQSYLPLIIKNYAFDSLCHEHITYFTFKQLNTLLKKYNLQIVDVKTNQMNGGSIRFFITKNNSKIQKNKKNLDSCLKIEKKFYSNLPKTLLKFKEDINKNKIKLVETIKNYKNNKKIIHVYGASTKGNILLQYFQINNKYIDFAADRNSYKWSKKTPGTNIPIISEKKSRKINPDIYLVLPWHFKDEFLIREKSFLKKGGRFIFPLPKVYEFKK